MKMKLTPQQRRERIENILEAARTNKFSLQEMGDMFSVTREYVRLLCSQNGVKREKKTNKGRSRIPGYPLEIEMNCPSCHKWWVFIKKYPLHKPTKFCSQQCYLNLIKPVEKKICRTRGCNSTENLHLAGRHGRHKEIQMYRCDTCYKKKYEELKNSPGFLQKQVEYLKRYRAKKFNFPLGTDRRSKEWRDSHHNYPKTHKKKLKPE